MPLDTELTATRRSKASRIGSAALLEQFETAARAAGASVERVGREAQQIAAAVERVAPPPSRIAVAESRDLDAHLLDACRRLPGVFTERTKRALAAADAGVTEAFAGVARTGSLCIAIDGGYAGYISLLARTHIAIVSANSIVERPADLFLPNAAATSLEAALRHNFVFVTGPSATADMGALVRGAHGPHRLHVLILE